MSRVNAAAPQREWESVEQSIAVAADWIGERAAKTDPDAADRGRPRGRNPEQRESRQRNPTARPEPTLKAE